MGRTRTAGQNEGVSFAPVTWFRIGAVAALASCLLLITVQIVSGDWLPPAISFSQYGVGPHGWLFSFYLLCFAFAPVCLDRARPTARTIAVMLLIGLAGCTLMALVSTDPGGLQHSMRAKVHMVGSVVGLSMTPLGMAGSMWIARRLPRPLIAAVIGFSTLSLILLLVSAVGVDTLGVGSVTSWAIWQTCAAVADVVLLILMTVSGRPRRFPATARVGVRHHDSDAPV